MNIHEFQAKQVLGHFEVPVPRGAMTESVKGAGILAKKIELKELIRKTSDLEGRLKKGRTLQEELEKTVRHIEIHLQKLFENRHQT